MKKEYKGVNIVITSNENGSNDARKEISAKDLSGILSGTSYTTIREAISLSSKDDDAFIIRMAQCVHGVLYYKYNKKVRKDVTDG